MKTKFIQKMMASALTVALIAAPSMGVMAAGSGDPITRQRRSRYRRIMWSAGTDSGRTSNCYR